MRSQRRKRVLPIESVKGSSSDEPVSTRQRNRSESLKNK